ncbi:helix-turn-helix transcriptional regulator [Paenibacillus hamazuiensis]|uniref:helix-turn-helix transcriptional regulator n=1 Tax=Paenibacillus hamazuiensis TaxID=2936508 RepID=UPI00200FE1DD|nr:AraC family transcriptional regulator [Paenibacillus hamazuiensis]
MSVYIKAAIDEPLRFASAGQFVSSAPWTHSKRVIDSYELIIGVHETLYIQQDDTRYEIGPGDVLLLLPGRVHFGYAPCSPDVSFLWLHFHCSGRHEIIAETVLAAELAPARNRLESSRRLHNLYLPLFSRPDGIERLHILFQQLQHVASSDYYTGQAADYFLTSLLIELSEQTVTHFLIAQNRTPAETNIARIMEWVRIHSSEDLSVGTIAGRFNYNKDYLSRFFKKHTGMNLHEYIHKLKLSKAKDLLSRTGHSIKEIAEAVGIGDEKYFMRLFKKYEKITPSEFRKAFYQTHMNNR